MADYNGRRPSDIPVNKNRNVQNSAGRQSNPYSYDDLVRRANGQAPVRRQQPAENRENNDIYVGRNSQPRQPQRNGYDQYREDISVSRGGRQAEYRPAEYSKGGSRKTSNAHKGKKTGPFRKIMAVLIVVAIIYVGITGYICSVFANTEYVKTESSFGSSQGFVSDRGVKNILLLGVDDKKGGTTSRSDSMILVSVDKKHRQLKLTSFLRDTYVEIPGHGENRLNAACTYGGPQLVMETIEHNFGIDIDNYVLVDFTAFKDMVDSLGGVTVEVEQREAEFINSTTRHTIDYGENVTLSGEEALVYVRIRKLDSDFFRTQRQRKVIASILDRAKNSNPFELVEMGKKVMSYIETDMNSLQLTFLAEGAVLSYMRYDMVSSRVPVEENYTSQMINGAYVLVIDRASTASKLQEFIYEKVEITEETTD